MQMHFDLAVEFLFKHNTEVPGNDLVRANFVDVFWQVLSF